MKTYVLQHTHDLGGGSEHVKLVGVYTSKARADAAKARLSELPGFSEAPNGFAIEEFDLNKDQWAKGYGIACGETEGDTLLAAGMTSTDAGESAEPMIWTESDDGWSDSGTETLP